MDVKLVGKAVQYHGFELLRRIKDEQEEEPSSALLSYLDRRQARDPEIKDEKFEESICTFIAKKSDLLFKVVSEADRFKQESIESIDDSYAIMPAIETFMDIPPHLRREHFYRSIKVGDCVTGVVASIVDNGLRVQLLCIDKGCALDIEELSIVAFCPAKELPKLYAHESALDAFQEKDIVRGVVLSVSAETERIIMSLHEKSIPDEKTHLRIGLITEDEFPVHFRRKSQIQEMGYEEMMHSILGFNNQGNVKALVNQLHIEDKASYLRFHAWLKIPEKEYAEGLKKWQSQKLAHKSVAQGVDMFKAGKYLEAMQQFNHALKIDEKNVEALVARGALYANNENFNHAIQDFEEALLVNPKHINARNYLTETLLTYGKICEDDRHLEEACAHYSHVLKLDSDHAEAKEMLAGCRQLLAFQTDVETSEAERQTELRSDEDDKDSKARSSLWSKTAEKLRQLINEDEKKRSKGKKKKENKGRSSSRSSRELRKKKGRRQRSCSDTSSSSNSRSSSSSDSRSGRKRKSRRDSSGSEGSHPHTKKTKRWESQYDDSFLQGERKGKRGTGQSWSEKSSENSKNMPDESWKDGKSTEGKPEVDITAENIGAAAAMSFLPISSFNFFSKSTSIPGLGSPPLSDVAGPCGDKKAVQQELGRNIERQVSPRDVSVPRRDEYLMAERKRFYNNNQDGHVRSKSSSGSRSCSSSRSPKRCHHVRRNLRDSRSRSKSPVPKSPTITGVKELDMYLGGAKKLLERVKSGGKFTTWQSFTQWPRRSRFKSRSRSKSHDRGSKSNDRRRFRSNDGRNLKSDDRRSRSNVKTSDSRRSRSHGRRSRSHDRRSRSNDRRSRSSDRENLVFGGKRSKSHERSRFKSLEGGSRADDKISRSSDRSSQSVAMMIKSVSNGQSREESQDRSGSRAADNFFVDSASKPNLICRERQSSGSSSKEKSFSESSKWESGQQRKSENNESIPAIYRGKESSNISPHHQHLQDYASTKETQQNIGAFVPRILRMPKMDDPSVNQKLMSSNELAILEKERKLKKIKEKGEVEERKEVMNNDSDSKSISPESIEREQSQREGKNSVDKGRRRNKRNSEQHDQKDRSQSRNQRRQFDQGSRGSSRSQSKQPEEGCRNEKNQVRQYDKKDRHKSKSPSRKLDRRGLSRSRSISKERSEKRRSSESEKSSKSEKISEVAEERKKWLAEEDIEKEIERRVQARLKEAEEKLRNKVLVEKVMVKKSRWDQDDRKSQAKITSEDLKRKKDENTSSKPSVNSEKVSKSGKDEKWEESGGVFASNTEIIREVPLIEMKRGWTFDAFGNKYFAVRGSKLQSGLNKDRFGNSFYAVEEEDFEAQQMSRGDIGIRSDIVDNDDHDVRERKQRHEFGSQALRQLEKHDDDDDVGSRIGHGDFCGQARGKGKSGSMCGRSRSKSRGQKSGSQDRQRTRSRSGERFLKSKWPWTDSRGLRSHSQDQRGSRSRSRDRSSRTTRSHKGKSGSRDRKSRSQDRRRGGKEHSKSPSRHDRDATTSDVSSISASSTLPQSCSPTDRKTSAVSHLPQSKWDKVSVSRWDILHSKWDVPKDSKEETKDGEIEAGDEEVEKQEKETLTDLEKFLMGLKQQKKKQWIAEGKLKEKD